MEGIEPLPSSLCGMAGCRVRCHFGYLDSRPMFCSIHQRTGMFNLHSQCCQHPGCEKVPMYMLEGGPRMFCKPHAEEGMVNAHDLRLGRPPPATAGLPVYQCCCGRYSSPAALYLYYNESLSAWVAECFQHKVTSAMVIERGGEPAFRAVDADVISEGSHEWLRYDGRTGVWSPPSSFRTKHLLNPPSQAFETAREGVLRR